VVRFTVVALVLLVVALGATSEVSTSLATADGRSWTSHGATTHGVANDSIWTSVVHGNGTFVAVSSTGPKRAMTSDDGVTWQMRDVTVGAWMSVTYGVGPDGTGRFVAVGVEDGAHVMTSPDGITWTLRSAPTGGWSSVTYGGGVFVAVSASNIGGTPWVMTSPDGVTWTDRTVDGNQRWSDVTYGNGRFVAVGGVPQMGNTPSTHRVMTSTDGVQWATVSASSGAPVDGTWYRATYGVGSDGVGRFVAVAYSGANRVMTSEDGLTWTVLQDAASEAVASGAAYYAVTYGSGTFMAVAYGSTEVMTSTDGLIWTVTESTPTQANVWTGVAHGGDVFVAVAENGTERVKRFGPNVAARPTTSGLSCVNAITSLTVSLTSDGGSPVTNYEYHIATSHPGVEPTTWQPFAPTQAASPLQWDMKALGYDPGVQHFYYVRAVNAMGSSPSSWLAGSQSSCSNSFVVDPPPAPTGVSIAAASDGITSDSTSTVSISGVVDGHTVTVSASMAGQADVSCTFTSPAASSCDLGPLSDGVWSVTTTQTSSRGITSAPSTAVELTVDTTPPTVVAASLDATGTQMTIVFDESLGPTPPTAGDLLVTVDGITVSVTSVSVAGSSLTLTLSTPVPAGGVATVVYSPPVSDAARSNAAVQDRAGNDAAAFTVTAAAPVPAPTGNGLGTVPPGSVAEAPVIDTGAGSPQSDTGVDLSPNDDPVGSPDTEQPAPVRSSGGELPRMSPGEHQVLENGQLVDVARSVVSGSRLVLRGPAFELVLSGDCSGDQCSIRVDESGRETLVLELDGKAIVSGFGFLPGSLVHVWIFSEPVYLGALTVAADGTFTGSLNVSGVSVGEHTLQVNGISFDDQGRTANLGVLIVAATGELPEAGVDPGPLLLLSVVLFLLGTLIISSRWRDSNRFTSLHDG